MVVLIGSVSSEHAINYPNIHPSAIPSANPQILHNQVADLGAAGTSQDDGGDADADTGACWDEARLRALSSEVDILANLRHPNVVMFMGVCLTPPCVVTEFCALGGWMRVGAEGL